MILIDDFDQDGICGDVDECPMQKMMQIRMISVRMMSDADGMVCGDVDECPRMMQIMTLMVMI